MYSRNEIAGALVASVGGRFSTAVGIDLDDGGDAAADAWFVCATLFGTRISASIASRCAIGLLGAGVVSAQEAASRPWDDLVALLDEGGYARYDFRTATRLQRLGAEVAQRCGATVAVLGTRHRDPAELERVLDTFSGWGPVTVHVFLRELRGVWPGAAVPLDDRTLRAARHFGLVTATDPRRALEQLNDVAVAAVVDVRDLEAACVRGSLAHRQSMRTCPGRDRCPLITQAMAAFVAS